MFRFERMLKIKQHFHTVPKAISSRSVTPFKLKSKFFPPGHLRSIDSFIQTIKHDVRKNVSNKTYTNLSPDEFIALRTLKEDKSIIIKPADKGGAIVVMDYADYREGMTAMLADTTSYVELHQNPIPSIRNALNSLINLGKLNSWLSDNTAEFLYNEHPRCPVIYGLPKIHKGTNSLKFRPIVSGTGSITQPLAQLLDHLLQPLVRKLPAYIKDTNDFLEKLGDGWKLATMDSGSLYTCIPNDAGLQAVRTFLTDMEPTPIPKEFLI